MTPDDSAAILIAVDIGNSRIKLGRFERPISSTSLPAPVEALELPLENHEGDLNTERLAAWCSEQAPSQAVWLMSSVHRGATERLTAAATELGRHPGRQWSVRQIALHDLPLAIDVDEPQQVGMDRLMAAVAANRLRERDRAAIVVDLGTAITVDLVTAAGAFAGGAILPGLSMSARALQAQTDALPRVTVDHWTWPPEALGKATVPAIESGLFWGAVGAIRELIGKFSVGLALHPEIIVSGGASQLIADVLSKSGSFTVRHMPHLVLSGIALVDQSTVSGS